MLYQYEEYTLEKDYWYDFYSIAGMHGVTTGEEKILKSEIERVSIQVTRLIYLINIVCEPP